MTTPSPTEVDLSHDERWELVTRMVASHHFGKGVQLRELLLYLGKRAIVSPDEDVSEREIGSRVLGRRPDYDPQADNIVRVQIRRLRQKLDEYYAGDGRNERVVISIPKGSHVLRFESRAIPDPVEPRAPAALPFANRWLTQLIAIAAIAAIGFFGGRISGSRSGAPAGASKETAAPIKETAAANPLWARMFLKDQATSIVLADSSFVIVQNVLQRNITLNQYIDGSYRSQIEAAAPPGIRDVLRMISGRQYTSLADATLSSELRSKGVQMGARVAVRYARHMNIRDFNSGNFILIGSRHGVPWVELFEPSFNFHFERVGKEQRFGFRNLRPLKGESVMYTSAAPTNGPQETYATISMLPNLADNGSVLMLAGVTMEATEAAGEFSMSNDFSQVIAKVLDTSPTQKLPRFQILLKVASMAGAPRKVEVVAWRNSNN
jgi:hypothetical protein